MQKLPEPLQAVVDHLSRLPGLGPKSALRAAMALLQWPEAEVKRMGQGIFSLRESMSLCERCGGLTESNPCPICADPARDPATLCVVAEWDSMLTLDAGGFYKGHYLILGGLIAPLEHMHPDALDLDRLDKRLAEGLVNEIILALGSTLEAENTASYIKKRLARTFSNIRITRLAQGIPLGHEVKFMDKETLRQSMRYRQEL